MTGDPRDAAREAAAAAALERVKPGMTIGLGSGRAVWKVVEAVGRAGIDVRAAAARAASLGSAVTRRIVLPPRDANPFPERERPTISGRPSRD